LKLLEVTKGSGSGTNRLVRRIRDTYHDALNSAKLDVNLTPADFSQVQALLEQQLKVAGQDVWGDVVQGRDRKLLKHENAARNYRARHTNDRVPGLMQDGEQEDMANYEAFMFSAYGETEYMKFEDFANINQNMRQVEDPVGVKTDYSTQTTCRIAGIPVKWNAALDDILEHSDPMKVVCNYETFNVTRRDLSTITPTQELNHSKGWLNDQIVDGFMQVIVETANAQQPDKRILAFSSFMMSTRAQEPDRQARRYDIEDGKLLEYDLALLPVWQNENHWILFTIHGPTRNIRMFDSSDGKGGKWPAKVTEWLQEILGERWILDEWRLGKNESPLQSDGQSCGVFCCINAMLVSMGHQPQDFYSHADITMLRRYIALTIWRRCLPSDLSWRDLPEESSLCEPHSGHHTTRIPLMSGRSLIHETSVCWVLDGSSVTTRWAESGHL